MSNMPAPSSIAVIDLSGHRVIILHGAFAGHEGICLGPTTARGKWSVSPDECNEVLQLDFPREFGALVDLSARQEKN